MQTPVPVIVHSYNFVRLIIEGIDLDLYGHDYIDLRLHTTQFTLYCTVHIRYCESANC